MENCHYLRRRFQTTVTMIKLFFMQGSDAAACQEWLQEQPINVRWLRGGRSSAAQCHLDGPGETVIAQNCIRQYHARTEEPGSDPLFVITGKNCLTGEREVLTPPLHLVTAQCILYRRKTDHRKARRKQAYTLLRIERHLPEQLTFNFTD